MHTACAPSGAHGLSAARVEVADIVRSHAAALTRAHPLFPEQASALRAIARCRTPALGGHMDVCAACGWQQPAYNSCRNRHCPKCQSLAQARWVAARSLRILPTHYFHVVFTLPAELRAVARANRVAVFDMLFAAASETLLELGADPKWIDAQLGITAVLHTWTRQLAFHPHLHCIVTGGGLTSDGSEWRAARRNFLLPVRVMGALFRGKMLCKLRRALRRGRLHADAPALALTLDSLEQRDWVVYAKRPFGGADHVIRYLGRYTHRIGISNQRLVAFDGHQVTFRTKDGKTITLAADEFLARFVSHVLPRGFTKIRHYGLLAPANVARRLPLARQRLLERCRRVAYQQAPACNPLAALTWQKLLSRLTGIDLGRCPACGALSVTRRPLEDRARAPPQVA